VCERGANARAGINDAWVRLKTKDMASVTISINPANQTPKLLSADPGYETPQVRAVELRILE